MCKLLAVSFALLSTVSVFADSNIVCGIYNDLPSGAPAMRLISNLDNDGGNAVMVNPALRFSIFVDKETVQIGFSKPAGAAKTVFSGSKRILKILDMSKGESIGWIDTVAPINGALTTEHYGICYYTGNGTKAPFDL